MLVISFIICLCIIRCSENSSEIEESLHDSPSLTVSVAKSWYNQHRPTVLTLKSANLTKDRGEARPDWGNAFSSKNDKFEVVEVSLISNLGFANVSKDAYDLWKSSNNVRYVESLPRLVIVKDKKTKKLDCFIMTISGDKEYLEKTDFNLSKNTYLNRDKNFSGQIFFHTLSGKFANGWKYKEGKITHSLKTSDDPGHSLDVQRTAVTCTTTYYYVIDFWVTEYYTVGSGIETFTGYGQTYATAELLYAVTECTYTESEDLTGGGYYEGPAELFPKVRALQNNNSLDSTQLTYLETAINQLTGLCMYESLYNTLVGSNVKINFEVGLTTLNSNGQRPAAEYYPSTNTIRFLDTSSISDGTIQEELVHAFQDSYYSNMDSNGWANNEFEAKLFQDLAGLGANCCFLIPEAPSAMKNTYSDFLESLKSLSSPEINELQYSYWFNLFRQYNPNYANGAYNSNNTSCGALSSFSNCSNNP